MGITFRFLSVAAKQQYRWHSRVSVFQAGLYFRSILDVFENKLGEPNLTPAIIFFRFCPILDSDCFPSVYFYGRLALQRAICMTKDIELLLRKGRELIAQAKITVEVSDAAIRRSRESIAALLHAASVRKLSKEQDSK